jgi:hypothetical protein
MPLDTERFKSASLGGTGRIKGTTNNEDPRWPTSCLRLFDIVRLVRFFNTLLIPWLCTRLSDLPLNFGLPHLNAILEKRIQKMWRCDLWYLVVLLGNCGIMVVVGQSARFDHILRPAADGAGGAWHLRLKEIWHWLAEVPHITYLVLCFSFNRIWMDLDWLVRSNPCSELIFKLSRCLVGMQAWSFITKASSS